MLSDRTFRSVCPGRRNISFPVYGARNLHTVSDDLRCIVVQFYLCIDLIDIYETISYSYLVTAEPQGCGSKPSTLFLALL